VTLDDLRCRATISVPQAGQILGIGRDAAYAAAARGEIPVLRIGRSLRVPAPALLAMLGSSGSIDSEAAAITPRPSPNL
jgi:excisionase family DNA binding protein